MKRMILLLVGVMVLSGLVLAATYSSLNPKIEENRRIALNASLSSLFDTEAELAFELLPGEGIVIYQGFLPNDELLGYAVRVEAQGYGGTMILLIGLSADLAELSGMQVVEQLETPGLGGRISEETFRNQFVGLDARLEVTYVKNVAPSSERNEIQGISGATISTKATVSAINAHVREAIDEIGGRIR